MGGNDQRHSGSGQGVRAGSAGTFRRCWLERPNWPTKETVGSSHFHINGGLLLGSQVANFNSLDTLEDRLNPTACDLEQSDVTRGS